MSTFIIGSTCPLSPEAHPLVLDQLTISLPVATYDSGYKKMVVHALSSKRYHIRGFTFKGAFIGASINSNAFNELAVFAASDIATFKGHEFGFRLSLKDNCLYGYVQDGKFFKNIKLINGDKQQHMFEVYYEIHENTCTFKWIMDGKLLGSYDYEMHISFNKYVYNIVCTTHRKEGDWSSEGLSLIISRIRLIYSSPPFPQGYIREYDRSRS